MHCNLAESGISQALLSEFSVSRIGCKAVEKIVARNAGHSFEMLYYLPKPILDFGKLFWVLNIVRNIRSHQLTVLDFDDHLPAFRHANAQSRMIGCSERSHRRIHGFFRISIRHRVKGIGPPRPFIMRISRSCRCECLKHLLQKDDKLLPEGFVELIMPKRWSHILYP